MAEIDIISAQNDPPLQALVAQLRDLIRDARGRALRAVDAIQVLTCREIGRHIVEFEQGGASRAEYGKRLLPKLAESLTAEFGRGFDASNLRYMRLFYAAFPIRDALRHELSWTHYRLLLRVGNTEAVGWVKAAGRNPSKPCQKFLRRASERWVALRSTHPTSHMGITG